MIGIIQSYPRLTSIFACLEVSISIGKIYNSFSLSLLILDLQWSYKMIKIFSIIFFIKLFLNRGIWLLVVLTALSVFVIQVGIRTGNYLEYKTTLDVTQLYKDKLEFPAITICNQNMHRCTN